MLFDLKIKQKWTQHEMFIFRTVYGICVSIGDFCRLRLLYFPKDFDSLTHHFFSLLCNCTLCTIVFIFMYWPISFTRALIRNATQDTFALVERQSPLFYSGCTIFLSYKIAFDALGGLEAMNFIRYQANNLSYTTKRCNVVFWSLWTFDEHRNKIFHRNLITKTSACLIE